MGPPPDREVMKKFLCPGGMTDEAVSNAVDVTIQTRTLRIHFGKFSPPAVFRRLNLDRPASLLDARTSRFWSGGIVADAPQPPANICDPSRVKNSVGEST